MERLQHIQRKEAGKQDEKWSKSELRHCLQRHKDNEVGEESSRLLLLLSCVGLFVGSVVVLKAKIIVGIPTSRPGSQRTLLVCIELE
jgi:hypothetical protein